MVATAPSPTVEWPERAGASPAGAETTPTVPGAAVGPLPRPRRLPALRTATARLIDLGFAAVAAWMLTPLDGSADLLLAALSGVAMACATQHLEGPTVPRVEILRRVVGAGLVLVVLAVAMAGLVGADVSPLELLAFASLTSVVAFTQRAALRRSPRSFRIVVAGHQHGVEQMLGELHDAGAPVTVAAVCLTAPGRLKDSDTPVSDGLDALPECVRIHGADAVVVVPCRQVDPVQLRRVGWQLERTGTPLFVGTGLRELGPGRARLGHAGPLPLIHVRHAQLRGARRVAKASWERTAAGLALAALAPVLITIAVVIRFDSRGPALFRQDRVGRDGTTFTMLKFRTMCVDAEDRLAALAGQQDTDGVLFKMRDDPRVTRVGRVLRRYSLDEAPQLINVVRGEMALVGPRPPLPTEVEKYDEDTRRRLAVTPGLTGLWQVSGRSDLSWEQSVRLDLRYVENWSIGLDLAIIARTVGAVLRHRGAY
jgi:exopolysaccharide biosynthesis polyprenyl glycosylphosphotransferase